MFPSALRCGRNTRPPPATSIPGRAIGWRRGWSSARRNVAKSAQSKAQSTRCWKTKMSHPIWTLLHHRMTQEHLGPYLPTFLVNEDERKAAEQFNERYIHGGWRPFGQGKFTLTDTHILKYPGDPPLIPIAVTHLRDELILLYSSDVV